MKQKKLYGNEDVCNFPIFSTRACVSGHQVSLAKRPRHSLHGTIIERVLP